MLKGLVLFKLDDVGVFLEGTKKQLKELLQKLNVDTKIWETEETML
ncbi:TPA: hypothetical protein ACSJPS_002925 [Listeria monocytogenes]